MFESRISEKKEVGTVNEKGASKGWFGHDNHVAESFEVIMMLRAVKKPSERIRRKCRDTMEASNEADQTITHRWVIGSQPEEVRRGVLGSAGDYFHDMVLASLEKIVKIDIKREIVELLPVGFGQWSFFHVQIYGPEERGIFKDRTEHKVTVVDTESRSTVAPGQAISIQEHQEGADGAKRVLLRNIGLVVDVLVSRCEHLLLHLFHRTKPRCKPWESLQDVHVGPDSKVGALVPLGDNECRVEGSCV